MLCASIHAVARPLAAGPQPFWRPTTFRRTLLRPKVLISAHREDRDHPAAHEDPRVTPERLRHMAEAEAEVTEMKGEQPSIQELADAAATGVKHLSATDPADAPAEGSEPAYSPEAMGLPSSESTAAEREERFEGIMQAIDQIGEGPEAAKLVAESYEGRDLDAEAMSTFESGDQMPHPGDRYLPPQAVRAAGTSQPGPAEARLNRRGPGVDTSLRHPALPLRVSAMRGAGPAEEAADDTIGLEGGAEGPLPGSAAGTADDQIGYAEDVEREALQGADAMYYTPQHAEHAAAGQASTHATEGNKPEEYDIEREALKGSDAMFYCFKASNPRDGQGTEKGDGSASSVRRAMGIAGSDTARPETKGQDQQREAGNGSAGLRADGQSPAGAQAGAGAEAAGLAGLAGAEDGLSGGGTAGGGGSSSPEPVVVMPPGVKSEGEPARALKHELLKAIKHSEEEAAGQAGGPAPAAAKRSEPATPIRRHNALMGKPEGRKGERRRAAPEATKPEPRQRMWGLPGWSWSKVLEVSAGRAALVGLVAAVASEILTRQSVLSQLYGRWEGMRQVEQALPYSRAAAGVVLVGALLLTLTESVMTSPQVPRWELAGLSPRQQLWAGRLAQAVFLALLVYETVHSNRPMFGTLFFSLP